MHSCRKSTIQPQPNRRHAITSAYTDAVTTAGGIPIILPPVANDIQAHLALCDAFVLTGGDDPVTEPFGNPTHPAAVRVHESRQIYETQLLRELQQSHPNAPVLGVCLGMQMMSLIAEGSLNQHLPDTHTTHADHWDRDHDIIPTTSIMLPGTVHSRHRQAISNPGSLEVLATSPDGLIEAVGDPRRRFYLGVQWHPERTDCAPLGSDLFARLIAAI